MTAKKIQISFQSNMRKVQEVIQDILLFVQNEASIDNQEPLAELRLIFSELLFNAVIHGNKQDADKVVHVEVEMILGEVHAVIADEGVGFDYSKVLAKQGIGDELFNENGRGIRLAIALSDNVTFHGTGNEIRFQKKVAHNG